MDMKCNGGDEIAPRKEGQSSSGNILPLGIPEEHLSTLVDMSAISHGSVCEGEGVSDVELKQSVTDLTGLLYEQAYKYGGADAIWKNPQDGSYHHPTFPENHGRAWEAKREHREECFKMDLIEYAADILAGRKDSTQAEFMEKHQYYEHQLLDIVEAEGIKGLIRSLIGWSPGLQENS